MTNRERLNDMTDDDFAEWLCRQFWDDFDADGGMIRDLQRYHSIRNWLKMEYAKGERNEPDNQTD